MRILKIRVGVWNREIKLTNSGCLYYGVYLCKKKSFLIKLLQKLKGPEAFVSHGCVYNGQKPKMSFVTSVILHLVHNFMI